MSMCRQNSKLVGGILGTGNGNSFQRNVWPGKISPDLRSETVLLDILECPSARNLTFWKIHILNLSLSLLFQILFIADNLKAMKYFSTFSVDNTIKPHIFIYFRNIGMEKKGVTLDNLICNVLKNTSDEFDFQDAHQDYFPKVISIKVPNYTKLHLAWSAIIPMTSDGSWITIWYSQDVHRTFQIKYGETLLFRSDVVHCGGRPGVDLRKEATYYRLHFYLQTEFQMAPDNEVNKFHIDGTTSLTTLYRQTIEQKKKYSNK